MDMHLECHSSEHTPCSTGRTQGRDTQQEQRLSPTGHSIPSEHRKHMLPGKNDQKQGHMNWHVHHRDILCFTHKTEGVCRSQQKLCPTISPSTSLVECDSEAQRSIQRCLNISSLKTTEQFFLYFKAFTCSLKTKQGIRSVYSTSSFLR